MAPRYKKKNNLKNRKPSTPPASPLPPKTKPAAEQGSSNSSPRKYKPVVVPYVSVPRLSTAAKKKYIGGGDSDPEPDSTFTKPLSVRPKVNALVTRTGPPRRQASTRTTAQASVHDPSSSEGSGEDNENVGTEDDGQDTGIGGDSIGQRLRLRRGAPVRTAQADKTQPKLGPRKKGATGNAEDFAHATKNSEGLPTTTQLQASKGDELRELGVGKGTGRRGVSGITNSFLGMQVDNEGQDRGILDNVPQESPEDEGPPPITAKAVAKRTCPPFVPSPWLRFDRETRTPTRLINLSTIAVYERPLTPETAPIHHVHDYGLPNPEDVPDDDMLIIWQGGRQSPYLGAPQTDRYTSTGYLRRRPEGFEETGVEEHLSYIQPSGDIVWFKVPNDRYIPEAYKVFDTDVKIKAIATSIRILAPFHTGIRTLFRIDNIPSATFHACEIGEIPRTVNHTMHCPSPRSRHRHGSAPSPALSQPRPFTQRDPRSPLVDSISSASRTSSTRTFASKRKLESHVHGAPSDDDPISEGEATPQPRGHASKRPRFYSPINEEELPSDKESPMDLDLEVSMHANPELDAVYEKAKTYAWYRDAEAAQVKLLQEGGWEGSDTGQFDWGVEDNEDDGEGIDCLRESSAKPKDDEEGFWLGQEVDTREDEWEEEEHRQRHELRLRDEQEQDELRRRRREERREQDEEEEEARRRRREERQRQDDIEEEEHLQRRKKRQLKEEREQQPHEEPMPKDSEAKEEVHRLREEKKAREIDRRLRDEQKAKEAARLLQQEQKAREEEHRLHEEQRAKKEEFRLREEQRAKKEGLRLRNEQRAREEEEEEQHHAFEVQQEQVKKAGGGIDHRQQCDGEAVDNQEDPGPKKKSTKGKGKEKEVIVEASTSTTEEVWTAQNIDELQKAGRYLNRLMDTTGLPLHRILKKLDLAVIYSRENSYNLFKRFIKETEGLVASFEDYNGVTSAKYSKIKKQCLAEGAEAWAFKQQEWKDTLIRHGGELQAPDQESAEVAGYMSRVIAQQQDLSVKVRNNGPVEMVSLVYSLDSGARSMSQFITANPDLDVVINNAPLDTREFIERILHTVGTFEVGLLDPATITWNDFQQAVIGDGSSSPPAPKPTKKGGKQGKADKGGPAGVDAITDFRGWAERIRKNQTDIPPEIKGIEREDRAKCRVVLRGLFADKLNRAKPSPVIWRHNFNNRLVTHKLVFYIPGNFSPLPGSKEWDPNDWSKVETQRFLDKYTENESYVRMERWSDENAALAFSDKRRGTVPILISSTPPRHVIKNVGNTLDSQVDKATSRISAATLGTDKPLEVARKRSEVRRDVAALHTAPTIKYTTASDLQRLLDDPEEEEEEEDN